MTLKELESCINELKDVKTEAAKRGHEIGQVERLIYDLESYYQKDYDKFPRACRNAFDEIVNRRIAAFPHLRDADAGLLGKFKASWRAKARSVPLKLYFGQLRVGPNLQGQEGGGNVAQQEIKGFPLGVIGRAINAVQGDLVGGQVQEDQIPIFIFWAEEQQKWICANNRGFTAHCKASKWPSRLIPRDADTAETNRLTEKKAIGPLGFTYDDAYAGPRLTGTERTLPSREMPITTGPNTWIIQDVVTVPQSW